jgi:hypothetical protein
MAEQKMNQEQALGVLVQAAKVGQSKGAYSLEDAVVIAKAIAVFTPPEQAKNPAAAGEGDSLESPEVTDSEPASEQSKKVKQ